MQSLASAEVSAVLGKVIAAMLIPEFWAEATGTASQSGKSVTLRRFGWSTVSTEDATSNAEARLSEAIAAWGIDSRSTRLREPKVAYNGAEGVPIREEIIEASHFFTITRNSYGALCLNSPNVLIADIDETPPWLTFGCWVLIMAALGGAIALLAQQFILALLLVVAMAILYRLHASLGRPNGVALDRKMLRSFDLFAEQNPKWGFRLYKTPNGYRILVTHRLFDPTEPDVQGFFRQTNADRLYVKMCLHQRCFRARLTAKPWRCGITDHMVPRSVWPISEAARGIREAWIERYESAARMFAACRFLKSFGPGDAEDASIQEAVRNTVAIHDKLTQCHTELPIA